MLELESNLSFKGLFIVPPGVKYCNSYKFRQKVQYD